jgi:hypothetical protein
MFLEHTADRMGDSSHHPHALGSHDDSQLLSLDSDGFISPGIVCDNDIMYCGDRWPDVGVSPREKIPALPRDVMLSDSTPQKPVPPTDVADAIRRELRQEMKTAFATQNETLSHLGSLMRAQFSQLAPPDKDHAVPSVASTAAAVMLAATHDADKARKNLGTGSWRPRPRGPPQSGSAREPRMRNENKPPTTYDELSAEMRAYLAAAHNIADGDTYARCGRSPCVLPKCGPRPNHNLDRCIGLFAASSRGAKFFGADDAAQRVRKVLEHRDGTVAFADVWQAYLHDDDADVLDGLHRIRSASSLLCAVCDGGEPDATDAQLVAAFDAARTELLEARRCVTDLLDTPSE